MEKTIDGLKAAAFPVLLGVVIYFMAQLLTEVKETGRKTAEILTVLAVVQERQQALQDRIQRLEELP